MEQQAAARGPPLLSPPLRLAEMAAVLAGVAPPPPLGVAELAEAAVDAVEAEVLAAKLLVLALRAPLGRCCWCCCCCCCCCCCFAGAAAAAVPQALLLRAPTQRARKQMAPTPLPRMEGAPRAPWVALRGRVARGEEGAL